MGIFSYCTCSYALSDNNQGSFDLQKQTTQLADDIKRIQSEASNIVNNSLLLGTEQTELEKLNQAIHSASLSMDALSIYEKIRGQKQINLVWQQENGLMNFNNQDSQQFFNVNSNSSNPVYICRAEFLGASNGTKGIYPGHLTKEGCRISYAGYAFTSSRYQVLINNNKNLVWMPIQKIKDIFELNQAIPKKFQSRQNQFDGNVIFNGSEYAFFAPLFHIDPTKPVLIAGGYEGQKPVYICRAKYNNSVYPGKLVIYMGENFTPKSACDIPVNDKEIVINNDYELLSIIPDTFKAVS